MDLESYLAPLTPSGMHRRNKSSGEWSQYDLPVVDESQSPGAKERRRCRWRRVVCFFCSVLGVIVGGAASFTLYDAAVGPSRGVFDVRTRRPPALPGVVGLGDADCAAAPDGRYPVTMSLSIVLENWPARAFAMPDRHFLGVCRFDYRDRAERAVAALYRDADVPFLLSNVPSVGAAADTWDGAYLARRLGRTVEYAPGKGKHEDIYLQLEARKERTLSKSIIQTLRIRSERTDS